ncbi:MAG: hypothetical protein ACI8ZM_000206 [Crocinitomix sp.]|jgi:hypothetical protein
MEEVLDNDMSVEKTNAPIIDKSKGVFRFSKLTKDELAIKVETFLKKKGYKIEEGTMFDAKYGKGSRVGRILLGAFIKRFAWKVTVESDGNFSKLTFYKEASGMVGGVIGVSQVNKEFNAIIGSLGNFHAGQESN